MAHKRPHTTSNQSVALCTVQGFVLIEYKQAQARHRLACTIPEEDSKNTKLPKKSAASTSNFKLFEYKQIIVAIIVLSNYYASTCTIQEGYSKHRVGHKSAALTSNSKRSSSPTDWINTWQRRNGLLKHTQYSIKLGLDLKLKP